MAQSIAGCGELSRNVRIHTILISCIFPHYFIVSITQKNRHEIFNVDFLKQSDHIVSGNLEHGLIIKFRVFGKDSIAYSVVLSKENSVISGQNRIFHCSHVASSEESIEKRQEIFIVLYINFELAFLESSQGAISIIVRSIDLAAIYPGSNEIFMHPNILIGSLSNLRSCESNGILIFKEGIIFRDRNVHKLSRCSSLTEG